MDKQYPSQEFKDAVESAPSLKGKYTKPNESLTELEKAILSHQGLINEDGTLKDEAIRKEDPKSKLPPGFSAPVPLEELAPEQASKLADEIADIKGEHAEQAKPDTSIQLDGEGVPPPKFAENDADAHTVEPLRENEYRSSQQKSIRELIEGSDEPVRCWQCGWDHRESFKPPSYTEEDKLAFIRHILSDGRFFKTYELFGGEIEVQFRSRTQQEIELIMEYARLAFNEQKLAGWGDVQAQLQRYNIVAAVAGIRAREDNGFRKFKPLCEFGDTPDAVKAMDAAFLSSGRSSGMFNIVTAQWMEFERLYGWFSSRAHDSDFWKAVAGDHS